MGIWAAEMPGQASKGDKPWPLRQGPMGHPCRVCGRIARYEYSPHGNWRACSPQCLADQGASDIVRKAFRERHGKDLPPSIIK